MKSVLGLKSGLLFSGAACGLVPGLFLTLALASCAVSAAAFGQANTASQSNSPGSSGAATLRVIVPWTHFKPASTVSANPASDPPAPQASGQELVSPQLSTTGLPAAGQSDPDGSAAATSNTNGASQDQPANPPGQPAQPNQSATAPALSAQGQQLYEADISKKHPHPPEPVKLPPADQIAAPLSDSEEPAPPAEIQNPPQSQTEASGANPSQAPGSAGAASAAAKSPQDQIAAITNGYENRRQDRETKLKSLQAGVAGNPTGQTNLQIEETKLELEGEQDRMQTGQQLSKQFALLAGELDARADKISKMADDRRQTALSAQAAIDQMKDLLPRRELALQNLAALPASSGNNQMIEDLKTEVAQEEATQKLNKASAQEAGEEAQTLSAEAAEISQEAAKARQRSATYAAIAQNAEASQNRLADRIEYDLARKSSAGMLAGVAKVIDPAPSLPGIATSLANPPAGAGAQSGTPAAAPANAPTDADILRECLRKTGKVDACLAQLGVS